MKGAPLLEIVAKLEICLEDLRAACRTVYDVGACAVLRDDHRFNSLCGRPFLRSGGLSKTPRVFVESLQSGNKQVFLPLPIQINRGACYSSFFCDIINRGPAITEITKPLYRRYENSLSRVFGFRSSWLFHRINDATSPLTGIKAVVCLTGHRFAS